MIFMRPPAVEAEAMSLGTLALRLPRCTWICKSFELGSNKRRSSLASKWTLQKGPEDPKEAGFGLWEALPDANFLFKLRISGRRRRDTTTRKARQMILTGYLKMRLLSVGS